MAPFEEFSTEDNQLLMSVLSSTPVSEQYNIAYPQSASSSFQMWDSQPYNPHAQAGYNPFNSPPLSHGHPHAHPSSRSPVLPHQSLSPQMHPSLASAPPHLVQQQAQVAFSQQPAHNPFAVRHDPSSHVPVKQESNMPVFTPTTSPYGTAQGQGMGGQFGQQPMPMPQTLPNAGHMTRTFPSLPFTPCKFSLAAPPTPHTEPAKAPSRNCPSPRESRDMGGSRAGQPSGLARPLPRLGPRKEARLALIQATTSHHRYAGARAARKDEGMFWQRKKPEENREIRRKPTRVPGPAPR